MLNFNPFKSKTFYAGLAAAAAIAVAHFQAGDPWTVQIVLEMLTPILAALGLRDAAGGPTPASNPEQGGASSSLLLVLALVGLVGLQACRKVAAQPAGAGLGSAVEMTSLRIGAVCNGPAGMTGCAISIFDSTANVSLASNVATPKGDTLFRTRACTLNETVVIGATFLGTAPGKSPSAPVGRRATGTCSATADAPTPDLIVEIVP